VTEHDAARPETRGLPDYVAPREELTGIEPADVAPDTVLPGALRGDSDIPDTEASDPLWQFPEGVPTADSNVAHAVSSEEGVIGALVDPDGARNEDRALASVGAVATAGTGAVAKAATLIGGEPPRSNLNRPGLPYDPVDPVKGWQDRESDAAKDAEIEAQIEAALAEPPAPIEVVRDPLVSLDTGRSVALPGLIAVALAAIALAFFLNLRGVGNPAEHGVPQETEPVATQPATPGNTGPTDMLTTMLPREAITITGGPGQTILMNPDTGETVTYVQPGQTIIYNPDTNTVTDITN